MFVLYGDVSRQFYVGLDCFVVRDVFLSVFLVDLLLQLRWATSTRSRLDFSASLGLLQYWHVCEPIERASGFSAGRGVASQAQNLVLFLVVRVDSAPLREAKE